jgi:hypothetical protein
VTIGGTIGAVDRVNCICCQDSFLPLILNPLSIGYISGRAKGKRQEAKGGINNQFLITGFRISL